ncbi:hypothetical protein PHYBOEH_010290 [Phytophthora boehmeriae]|uniref:Uncharacterized protein n=1 Tax=Phytophthora boehmeriae TaxID=109152 RepID=A0A8T1X6S4_9STRA|nr:hypothetical protein PHYBOEH_010290 [Phytophthora boehmeriae]
MDTPKVLTGEGRRNGATMSESEEGGGFQIVDEADTTEGDKSTLKSSKDDDRNEGDSEAVSRDGDKGQIMVQDDVVVIDAAETQSSKDTDNSVEPPVTEALDSGELSEQGGLEGSAVIDQTRQISSIDLTTTANSDELSVDNLSEAFVHTHADAISAAVARRRISHDDPQITLKKLASYMEKNQIANRAEVRQQNPELWHEFVTASLPLNAQLGPCRLCRSPNDGRNQRFNSTVLCVNCLKDALELLEMRVDESASS